MKREFRSRPASFLQQFQQVADRRALVPHHQLDDEVEHGGLTAGQVGIEGGEDILIEADDLGLGFLGERSCKY